MYCQLKYIECLSDCANKNNHAAIYCSFYNAT